MTSPAFATTKPQQVLQAMLDDYMVPAYLALVDATDHLLEETDILCTSPSDQQLTQTKIAFKKTIEAWGNIEWARVGSVMERNRVERFFYFPDRKSRGLRQVQAALAKEDITVLDLETLQEKSVALQGIGALDFIFSGKDSKTLGTGNAFRCQYALTVANNLNHIARTLYDHWQTDPIFHKQWILPDDTNPFFRTDKEAMNIVIGILIHGLEAIRDTRIMVFLRETPARDRPKSAPLWRSNATLSLISANLEGLEALFLNSQIDRILPQEANALKNTIRFDFTQSINTARSLNAPIAELLTEPVQREKLTYLKLTLTFLIDRLNHEFSPAAGLSAGFSFGDGD